MRGDSVVARARIMALDKGTVIAKVGPNSLELIEPGDLVSFD
ncbi:MAG: hypothetical protein ABF379_09470 [Akkermansiaceae bacterium]